MFSYSSHVRELNNSHAITVPTVATYARGASIEVGMTPAIMLRELRFKPTLQQASSARQSIALLVCSKPKPNGLLGRGNADETRQLVTCKLVQLGQARQISATAPVTCGVDIDVPSINASTGISRNKKVRKW
jgi:hypothetical protein